MPLRGQIKSQPSVDLVSKAGRVAAAPIGSETSSSPVVFMECATIDEHLMMAESLWKASGAAGTALALPHYEAAAELAKEAGDHMKECMIALGHGYALRHLGRDAAARALLRKAKRMAEKYDCDEAAAFADRVFRMEVNRPEIGKEEVCTLWRSFANDKSSSHPVSLFIRGTPMETRDAVSRDAVQKMRAIGVVTVYVVDVSCPGPDFPPGLVNIGKSPHVSFPQLYLNGQEVPHFLGLDIKDLQEMMGAARVEMRPPQLVDAMALEAMEDADLSGMTVQRKQAKSKKGKRKSKVSVKRNDVDVRACHIEDAVAKENLASDVTRLTKSDESDQSTFKAIVPDLCPGTLIQTPTSEDGFADDDTVEAINAEEVEGQHEADSSDNSVHDNVLVVTNAETDDDGTESRSGLPSAETIALTTDGAAELEDVAEQHNGSFSAEEPQPELQSDKSRSLSSLSDKSRCSARSLDSTTDGWRRQVSESSSDDIGTDTGIDAGTDASTDASADAESSSTDDVGPLPRSPRQRNDTWPAASPTLAFALPPLSPFLVEPPRFEAGHLPPPPGLATPEAGHGLSFRPPPGLVEPFCSPATLAEENARLRHMLAQQASELASMWHMVAEGLLPVPELQPPRLGS